MTKARRPPAGPDIEPIEPICDQVTGRVYSTVENWDAALDARRNGATTEEPDVGEPALGLEESEPAVEEGSRPALNAAPSGTPKAKGRGNRPSWRGWKLDLAAQERVALTGLLRKHPTAIAVNVGDKVNGASVLELSAMTTEALRVIHPAVLYRLLTLDGFTHESARAQSKAFTTRQTSAESRILSPRVAARVERQAADAHARRATAAVARLEDEADAAPPLTTTVVRRDSTKAQFAGALAKNLDDGRRELPLGMDRKGRIHNNRSQELAVIDVRLEVLRDLLRWSHGRLALLIVESMTVWSPAPCPERVGRWTHDDDEAGTDVLSAERWLSERLASN